MSGALPLHLLPDFTSKYKVPAPREGPCSLVQTPWGHCCYSVPASGHLLPWHSLTTYLCCFSRALGPRLSCLVIQLQNEPWSGGTNRSGEKACPADGDCTGQSPPPRHLGIMCPKATRPGDEEEGGARCQRGPASPPFLKTSAEMGGHTGRAVSVVGGASPQSLLRGAELTAGPPDRSSEVWTW